jgi:hypothetical protein
MLHHTALLRPCALRARRGVKQESNGIFFILHTQDFHNHAFKVSFGLISDATKIPSGTINVAFTSLHRTPLKTFPWIRKLFPVLLQVYKREYIHAALAS